MKKYDVIIGGASFAGLAVASKLDGKILLVDQKNIGTHRISACGTLTKFLEEIGCEKAILQTFDTVAVHVADKEIEIPIPEFCTFDYKLFCELLAEQSKAEFLRADVKGVKGDIVTTNKGRFQADIIIDCTGWRAVLASSVRKNYVHRNMVSFGIETELPYRDNKLRFFLDDKIIKGGVAWLFPAGKKSRFGVASYVGKTKILKNLKRFVAKYNLKIRKINGGFFCYDLKESVVKNIFVVGCAAGQTLPLTGEGIRRSVYFGLKCGEIIQKIVNKEISLEECKRIYREITFKHERGYNLLLKMQDKLIKTPNLKIIPFLKVLAIKPIAQVSFGIYKKI